MRFAYELDGSVDELASLRSSLESWAQPFPSLVDELLIVASELAANAITHGQAPAQVGVFGTGQSVRISVRQHLRSATTYPRMERSPRGRQGLRLVDRLSTSWGWGSTTSSLVVWAEIHKFIEARDT